MWSLFISLSQSIGMWFPFLVRGSNVTKISNQKRQKPKQTLLHKTCLTLLQLKHTFDNNACVVYFWYIMKSFNILLIFMNYLSWNIRTHPSTYRENLEITSSGRSHMGYFEPKPEIVECKWVVADICLIWLFKSQLCPCSIGCFFHLH